jgi:hypothetical protein
MPRKAKGSRPKPGGRPRARVATKGLRVTAVKATAGRAATSVNVEVEPEELKSEVGEFDEVRSVSARIPEESEGTGRVRWRQEALRPAGASERETEGRRRTVRRYFNVHYGPSPEGLGVEVETDRGRVKAPRPGEAYAVKSASQPGESEVKKRKR